MAEDLSTKRFNNKQEIDGVCGVWGYSVSCLVLPCGGFRLNKFSLFLCVWETKGLFALPGQPQCYKCRKAFGCGSPWFLPGSPPSLSGRGLAQIGGRIFLPQKSNRLADGEPFG